MTEPNLGAEPIQMLDLAAQRRAIGSLMEERISRVLDHGAFILGPEVGELETELASRAGVRHVVTCANGTDALQLVLMAWGIGPGDAVFVPAFTFTATAEVVSLLGATPVFCDVDAATFNLDVSSLTSAIQGTIDAGELTPRAIIPVDLFGLPADYPAIQSVAEHFELRVLADAAQSFGADQGGRPVGSLAEVTATSFFPAKPLGCYGDGGAVFTNDGDLAAILRSLRVHGKGSDKYDTVRIGMNSRLDTIQAAILLAKLTVFDEEIVARRRVANQYSRALASIPGLRVPPSGEASAWAQYTVTVGTEPHLRDNLAKSLRSAGIPTAVYYPRALHEQPAFLSSSHTVLGGCPTASLLSRTVLSLPMHPYLRDRDVDAVCKKVAQEI